VIAIDPGDATSLGLNDEVITRVPLPFALPTRMSTLQFDIVPALVRSHASCKNMYSSATLNVPGLNVAVDTPGKKISTAVMLPSSWPTVISVAPAPFAEAPRNNRHRMRPACPPANVEFTEKCRSQLPEKNVPEYVFVERRQSPFVMSIDPSGGVVLENENDGCSAFGRNAE
jgi:hypothetical protein